MALAVRKIGSSALNNCRHTAACVLLFLVFISGQANAQEIQKRNERLSFSITAGYSAFGMQDARDYFQKTTAYYRQQNIKLSDQKLYPGNFVIGMNALLNAGRSFHTGIGVQYSSTKAVSSYEDVFGNIDVESSAGFLNIEWVTRKYFFDYSFFRPFAEAGLGVAIARFNIKNELSFNELTKYNYSAEVSEVIYGPSLQGKAGVEYSLNSLIDVSVSAGYSYIKTPEGNKSFEFRGDSPNSEYQPVSKAPVPAMDFSGFNYSVCLGLRF